MSARQKAWAVRARWAIVRELGGHCAVCGSTVDLELDHPYGRSWCARLVGSDQRIALYRADAASGNLRVLCSLCNASSRPVPRPVPALQLRTVYEPC